MKYSIFFDTICSGYSPVMLDEKPIEFDTEAEANAEIDSDPEFYEGCFVDTLDKVGHKTIYTGEKP